MSPAPRSQRLAGWLIRAASHRLPADVRDERCREWTAELPAILDDQSIRPPFLRTLRAFSFCAGVSWTTRQLSRSARAASHSARNARWHTGAMQTRPSDLVVRAVRGVLIWLVVVAAVLGLIALLHAGGLPKALPVMLGVALVVGFDGFCLADIARSARVRYLHKWVWVLICLIQCPLGGIMYLSIGHVGRHPSRPGN